jgi:hypothetical protein
MGRRVRKVFVFLEVNVFKECAMLLLGLLGILLTEFIVLVTLGVKLACLQEILCLV